MKVCLIANEFFAWGKHGGYGSAARLLARELTKRGLEITVVTPRRGDQHAVDRIDGVTIWSYRPPDLAGQFALYRQCDADIYHALETYPSAALAQCAMPERRHVVRCCYVRQVPDLLHEVRTYLLEARLKPIVSLLYEHNSLVAWAVRRADAVTCVAEYEGRIARRKFRLKEPPILVPPAFQAATRVPQKAATPTVCFVGRWERRKNPEAFFELARRTPAVRFIALGKAQNRRRDAKLRRRYANLPNLEMPGFVDQFTSPHYQEILSRSWILVNTSKLEGLPMTFLEAASHGCAILSRVDPDGFATRFGYRAQSGDFAVGLDFLLHNDEWRRRGEKARACIESHYDLQTAIAKQIEVYERVMGAEQGRSRANGKCPDHGHGTHAA